MEETLVWITMRLLADVPARVVQLSEVFEAGEFQAQHQGAVEQARWRWKPQVACGAQVDQPDTVRRWRLWVETNDRDPRNPNG